LTLRLFLGLVVVADVPDATGDVLVWLAFDPESASEVPVPAPISTNTELRFLVCSFLIVPAAAVPSLRSGMDWRIVVWVRSEKEWAWTMEIDDWGNLVDSHYTTQVYTLQQ
jgi:hypothetical protein